MDTIKSVTLPPVLQEELRALGPAQCLMLEGEERDFVLMERAAFDAIIERAKIKVKNVT